MQRQERPPRSGQTQWRRLAFAAALIAASFGAVVYFQRRNSTAAAPPSQREATAAPEQSAVTFQGRVRARNVVPIAAPIDGILENVEVIEGQNVFEGQLLARIRNSTIELGEEQAKMEVERVQERLNSLEGQLISMRLEASRAEADAAQSRTLFTAAEKNYLRQKMLLSEGATPRLTFEKSEKDYQTLKGESEAVTEIARQATAKVEIAQKNIEETRKLLSDKNEELDNAKAQILATEIHSPVDGVLVGVRATAGSEVTGDMKNLFEVAVNLTELELVAEATAAQVAGLKPGQPAVLQIAETGNEPLGAIVKSIKGTQVILEFSTANPAVKPGLTGQARIELNAPQPTSRR